MDVKTNKNCSLILDGNKKIVGRPEALFGFLSRVMLQILKNKDLAKYVDEIDLDGLEAMACSNICLLKEDVEESKQKFAIWYEPNKEKTR